MIELSVVGSSRPALVDECDAHLVGYRWRLDKQGYVFRKAKGRCIFLHRAVMGMPPINGQVVDHIGRDKMDNRRQSMRWLTRAESNQNRGAAARNVTGVRGLERYCGSYRATVRQGGAVVARERFTCPDQAAAWLKGQRLQRMSAAVD